MAHRKELAGSVYGRLTVIKWTHKDARGKYYWECVCDCGKIVSVMGDNLVRNKTKSCGCIVIDICKSRSTKHGHTINRKPSREYIAWGSMIARCYNEKNGDYKNYGGRGISVCPAWRASFESFYKDMGQKPTPRHSLDRYPDVNGNYEKENCRWATPDQQSTNKRGNRMIEVNGQILAASQWAKKLGIHPSRIYRRLKKGFTGEKALS